MTPMYPPAPPRNDVDAAIAYYEERGRITRSEVEMLLMLQDDDTALRAAMRGWRVDDETAVAVAANDAWLRDHL